MALTEMSPAEQEYNFPPPPPRGGGSLWADDAPGRVSPALIQMAERFRGAQPKLGDEAPDFHGMLLDGGEFVLSRLRGQQHVILLFGSLSDPPCVSNVRATKPSLAELHEQYQARGVQLLWVYTREAFPGPGVPAHTSFEQKLASARRFRDEVGVPFPIVVDSLDGQIHKRYALLHNPTYAITRGGVIVYRATNLDSTELSIEIENLLAWEQVENNGQVVKRYYSEHVRMARAPYREESRLKEREALERIGPETYERIKQVSGFDPYTWRRVEPPQS